MNAIKVGTISKPLAFLNINNYFDDLLNFITHCKDRGFMSPEAMPKLIVSTNPDEAVRELMKVLEPESALAFSQ